MIWQMTYTHKMPKLCSATLNLYVLLLPFIALLQNKHTTLVENGENLISAHLELAPTL